MIDETFKDELGKFEQSYLGFDMGNDRIFKGFAICNGKLHILFSYKEKINHPLNCEPAMDFLDEKSVFAEMLKDFAFKEAREYALNKRKKNGK